MLLFDRLVNLQDLKLSNNVLTHLDANLFGFMKNLKYIFYWMETK